MVQFVLRYSEICSTIFENLQLTNEIAIYYNEFLFKKKEIRENETLTKVSNLLLISNRSKKLVPSKRFQQTVGIPIGSNFAPLLADLFLYYYEADFMQELHRKIDKKLMISFNSTFRYIDDVLSLNNSKFGDYVERIYPIKLEI